MSDSPQSGASQRDYPFDMAFLLKNPTVIDAVLVAERGRTQVVLINMFDRQFIVVDGIVMSDARHKRAIDARSCT